jgi:uncharacterized protein (TIGR03437 family)
MLCSIFFMPRPLATVLLALAVSWTASAQSYTISTLVGGALPVNIPGTSASLYGPSALAVDKSGNVLVADGNTVLRLDAATGVLTVIAGNGTSGFSGDNGLATGAQLNLPQGVALDTAGNLYIADTYNNRVRKVTNGVITTVAGTGSYGGDSGDNGAAISAQLAQPWGIAVDSAGNLYISEPYASRIRKVSGGVIATFVRGSSKVPLNQPWGLAVDSADNLYIAGQFVGAAQYHGWILKVSSGVVTTVAGGGNQLADNIAATSAGLTDPKGVAVDSDGNLYIADFNGNIVRKVSNGTISTVAGGGAEKADNGDNGPATSAQVYYPSSVAVDSAGNVYIAGTADNRIRKVSKGVITTVAGGGASLGDNGPASSAQFDAPCGVAIDPAGNLYIADTSDSRIRKVSGGVITTVAGGGASYPGDNGPATSARLYYPRGVALDSAGSLYIAETNSGLVRKVSGGVITTVAGGGNSGYNDGPATSAELLGPTSVAVDSAGTLYIADPFSHAIRKVSNGVITTAAGKGTQGFSGDDGPATGAQLNQPSGVAVDSAGNLYIADSDNNRIRKVSKGVITTVAGNATGAFSGDNGLATSAELYKPSGIAFDPADNLYIADTYNVRIRRVSGGVITTVAGNGTAGVGGDKGLATSAQLSGPTGVAVDSAGNLYVADADSDRIRLLTPGAPSPAISQSGNAVQPGSWVSIYGSNLASEAVLWNGDFPESLGGTRVTIDNKAAYLWYVSPTQINLQVPDDTATGPVNMVVTTASGTAASAVTLASYGPSFSLLGDGKHVAGEIATPDGTGVYGGGTYDLVGPPNTFSYNTRPVKAGETLVLFGVGFGPTTPPVPAGQPFSSAAPTSSPVTITIGGVPAYVAFSGITEAGLYQFNLTVPPGTGSGDQALQATVGGVKTAAGPVVSVQ